MIGFDILDNGLGIVSGARFVFDFSTKILLSGCLYVWDIGQYVL